MAKAVISGIGPDRPGIVAAIGQILLKHGCNIEDSTMTRLAQEFAVILIVSMPDTATLAELQRDMALLEVSHQLTTLVKAIPDALAAQGPQARNPYMISVAGHDQAGLTFHVSQKLSDLGINITDLNAQVITGEDDRPVYIMMVEVDVPPAISVEALRHDLQALACTLNVEIQVRPLEALAL